MDANKNNRARQGNPAPGPAGDSGYGYGYGDLPYGYGDESPHRTIRDYILILRERMWYILAVLLIVFSGVLIFTLTRTKVYKSTATVQVFRHDPVVLQIQEVMESGVRSAEDLNTQVRIMESRALVEQVLNRLEGGDLRRFLAPFENSGDEAPPSPAAILNRDRKVVPQRASLMVAVEYMHPDPEVAALVANLFVEEYLAYNTRIRVDESMKAVEELKQRADEQRLLVEQNNIQLQAYRERTNTVSLDQRKDIVTEKLKALNARLTETGVQLRDAEVRWRQVREFRETGRDLTELPFIANQPLIADLTQRLASRSIEIARLSERYRAAHPQMIEAVNELRQTERELTTALNIAAAKIESEHNNAVLADREARLALVEQERESMLLDKLSVEYDNLEREYLVNEQLLQSILSRMRETAMSSTIETQSARIVDPAMPPNRPFSPNVVLNLGLGLVGGLGLGLGVAFFVAFLDDRVKSVYDIEGAIGLRLMGIIPETRKLDDVENAQVAATNADRQAAEGFLSLHSSLRLNDESKDARVILVTSTIPGEGKSFISSNLALTFAAHGERTVLVDCDLRKPTVHRFFKLSKSRKGLIDYCTEGASLDDVVVASAHANFDLLPAGGRARNPTHVLNSKRFEELIAELRLRYDRVFLDTPPLAAVSDAMVVLPFVDGSLFSIYFNKVRRKAAQFSSQKLMEANVPCFGAVLNALNLDVSGYYYAQYYDKSYKDYYVALEKVDDTPVRG